MPTGKRQNNSKLNTLNIATHLALQMMALAFNYLPKYRRYLRNSDGWLDFNLGIKTDTGSVAQSIRFKKGRVSVSSGVSLQADVVLKARNDEVLKEMASAPPNEILNMMLRNRITTEGNLTYLQLFNFYLALLVGGRQQKVLDRVHREDLRSRKAEYGINDPNLARELKHRHKEHLDAGPRQDSNVIYLEDPYLSGYDLEDFPRLQRLLDRHLNSRPEICAERPELLTNWFREYGFETDRDGEPWQPVLRQGYAFKHLMEHKKPVIAGDQLLAGTTTAIADCGVIVYPDAQGTMIWGELNSIDKRHLNPYTITSETRETLNEVFPFWIKRSFRELVRQEYNNPLCLQIDEHWVAYFCWKSVAVSHTVPDFRTILKKGTSGLIADIETRLNNDIPLDNDETGTLNGMRLGLEGVNAYAASLVREAGLLSTRCKDPARRRELEQMASVCGRVPQYPAATLDEAVQAVWIVWIALHMENTNTGLSLGRLDQWLQPYFLSDMAELKDEVDRKSYVRHAIELIGSFYLRLTDHMPLSPDIGNYLFGGSPADQAITLGGVTPDGGDGVNDMTYIFLKVTEMLSLHDPNINARINLEKNSETYIKRLCEVNFSTAATPSMHNDAAVFQSLQQHGYPPEHFRDWCAIGCVEPTICGRHSGHTGSILMNLVAALEMALNNGRHPLMAWDLGPRTGDVENFRTFDDFFNAYASQQRFLITQAVTLNNMYAGTHARLRPTPLLSSLLDGCIGQAKDATNGGACYNTSGSSNIGLSDITDSLMVIKKLVFEENKVSFSELKRAIDSDFTENPKLLALIRHKVPRFGSGNPEALDMCRRVTALIHGFYAEQRNYRGGRYTSGFWSMSQHVAYGNLSGTLPSGRLRGKAFTPGLTPSPNASKNYLDFISDVARLEPTNMDNNIAFNVKLIPSSTDSREKTVENMASYVKTYCRQGGMQMQFNVVDSRVLKDAMANPENYRNLIVRISGYNAYFVSLNKQQQIELIERAEYGV